MKKYRIVAALAAAALTAAIASADVAKRTLGVEVEQYRLANGLTVLLSRDTRLPLVAVEVRYLVGSANEKAGRTGFAHLFEHLMYQGSKNFDDEYFAPFAPIGASVNGTTSTDRTNYFETVPSNYLELALWMESDRMENLLAVLTQAKLDNQRDVVKNERRQSYENRPYGGFWLEVWPALFPEGHPYDHATIGSHDDLGAAGLEDFKAFFTEYYVPANAVLTVVGDFDEEQARGLIRKYFGPIPGGKRAPDPEVPGLPVPEKSTQLVLRDDVKLPRIHLMWHTPRLFAPGDAEMDVLASILAGGKTSRLYRPLVFDEHIARDVQAYQVSLRYTSFFVIQATAAPGVSSDELARRTLRALRQALATAPDEDEVQRAVNGWRKSYFSRVETVMSRAQLLSTYFHFQGTPDYLQEDLDRYSAITPATVQAAAKQFVNPDVFYRIDVVPAPFPRAAEGRAGEEVAP